MDAFEQLVAGLLEHEGFWVRSSFKVDLTKAEKRAIRRPSTPRWEIDLVAYKGHTNELRLVECKSFLNSRGVTMAAVAGKDRVNASRYKLFGDAQLRGVVKRRLVAQLREVGAIRARPRVTFCLAAGRVASEADRRALKAHFRRKGWELMDEAWLRGSFGKLSQGSYQDRVAAVVAKVLLRVERRSRPTSSSRPRLYKSLIRGTPIDLISGSIQTCVAPVTKLGTWARRMRDAKNG